MGADIIQVGITTLASGGLAAISSYIAIVWKLNARVTKLEETVEVVRKTVEDLKENQKEGDQTVQKQVRAEFDKEVERLKEDAAKASVTMKEAAIAMEAAKKDIILSVGTLQTDISNFKVSCAENRAKMVSDKRWAEYTKEQASKWEDFNRVLGKLEGAISRLGASTKTSSPSLPSAGPVLRR